MKKKLTKHGNSHALVIDKAVMDLLRITSETELDIYTDDGERLIVKPVKPQFGGQDLRAAEKKGKGYVL